MAREISCQGKVCLREGSELIPLAALVGYSTFILFRAYLSRTCFGQRIRRQSERPLSLSIMVENVKCVSPPTFHPLFPKHMIHRVDFPKGAASSVCIVQQTRSTIRHSTRCSWTQCFGVESVLFHTLAGCWKGRMENVEFFLAVKMTLPDDYVSSLGATLGNIPGAGLKWCSCSERLF